MSQVVVDFVLLTYGTSSDEGIDKRGQSRPPEIPFQECFGMESSCMSGSGGVMYGMDNGLSFMRGNVHAAFEV